MCDSRYENVAFCLDSKGKVFRKGVARSGKLHKGDIIYNGDKITVGIDGLITLRNIYERSEIKVFENSSIKIVSKKNRKSGEKEFKIAILGGRVIIDKNEFCNSITSDDILAIKSPFLFFEKYSIGNTIILL